MVIPPDTLRSDRDMPVLLRFYLRHAMEDTAFTLAASDQMLAYREKSLTQQ
jgi:hypothetical protein